MQGDNPISWLMFFTLASGVFIIAGSFIYFLRSRTNREIAANALEGDGSGKGVVPSGAAPELLGFAAIVLALMALLAIGYSNKSTAETAQKTGPLGTTNSGMAQDPGTADRAKTYQPANPVPDTRAAPTSSDTGVGSASGGQPK